MAIPFYIAEGLASSFGSIAGKAYWGKKKKKTDPFKQSGIVNEQKSKKMPTTSYAKKRNRDFSRRIPASKRIRTSTKKKKYRRSSKAYSKRRKPKTQSMSTKRHYDDSGNVSRNNVAWFGAQVHGSRDRIFDIVGEAVLRAMLARAKVYPRKYDEPLSNYLGSVTGVTLNLTFRSQSELDGTDTYVGEDITNIQFMTFKTLANEVSTKIQTRTGTAVAPSFLTGFKITSNSIQLCEDSSCEDMRLSIYCRQLMKLQNTTQTNDNTNDLDVIGVNPVVGKRYVFNDNKARVHTGIIASDLGSYHAFEQAIDSDGIIAMNQLASGDDPLAHPPAAKSVWSNCVSVQNCYMKAGGFATSTEDWKWTGSMRSFVEDLIYTGVSRTKFGRVVWWCFERANRNGGADTHNVSIGFNRELSMSAFAKLHKRPSMLKHYDNNAIGSL